MYNRFEDILRWLPFQREGGGGAMSIFETLSLMIAFGTLIALIVKEDK